MQSVARIVKSFLLLHLCDNTSVGRLQHPVNVVCPHLADPEISSDKFLRVRRGATYSRNSVRPIDHARDGIEY